MNMDDYGRPEPIAPSAGQESVWSYPRPPRVEASDERVEVLFGGRVIADSTAAYRVLETSHAPVYYLPLEDVDMAVLAPVGRTSTCEFKGLAVYYDLVAGRRRSRFAAWRYPRPAPGYDELAETVAFYPQRVDECRVDGETVRAVDGDFYGGWITSRVTGPFKGGPGSWWW